MLAAMAERRGHSRMPPSTKQNQQQNRSLIGRLALLFLLLVGIAITLAVPIQEYVSQQALISQLEQEQAATKEIVAELEAKKAQFDDPAYIERIARERFRFVKPGDELFIVVQPENGTSEEEQQPPSTVIPWYEQMWQIVQHPLDGVEIDPAEVKND